MKKALVIILCVILVLAVPLAASAAGKGTTTKNGMEKEVKIKEVEITASEVPVAIGEGTLVEVIFSVPRSGSNWQYGETTGLLEPVTIFNEETCTYETTAVIDTTVPGSLDIVFEFIMTAGKSHVQFFSVYEASTEITGESKDIDIDITYFWNQDFTDNADGWLVGASAGTITLDSGTALIEAGTSGGGPYSFFEGSNKDWIGDWYASIKIFIDPTTMTVGENFTYVVASNKADGTYLTEEFAFTATGNPTSTGVVIESTAGLTQALITTPGWYTFQHHFYNNAGFLTVNFKLLAEDNAVLLDEAVNTAYAIPADVGGSRYGWFTEITDDDGILIDDFQRYSMP